jgi:hypothetical protein
VARRADDEDRPADDRVDEVLDDACIQACIAPPPARPALSGVKI